MMPADLGVGRRPRGRAGTRASRARSRTPCRPARRRRPARPWRRSRRGSNRSGCQPRRYSSPAVAFCVQPMWPFESPLRCTGCTRCTRGSRPGGPPRSSRGRNGSAIDGRAAPMMSQTPERTISAIWSAFVSRPTPTIGLLGRAPHLARPLELPARREEPRHAGVADHSEMEPMLTSHRCTRRSASRMNSSALLERDARLAPPGRRRAAPRSRSRGRRRRPASRAARPRTAPG